jgi:hypothetical protein
MRNSASHLSIFPTLLDAFGYSPEWVRRVYGAGLAGPREPCLTYVSLGWSGQSRGGRRKMVDTAEFVKTVEFPRREQHGAAAPLVIRN